MKCTYTPLNLPEGATVYDEAGLPIKVDGAGKWYGRECVNENGGRSYDGVYLTPANPAELRDDALAQLSLPGTRIGLNPPADRPQIVNVQTWLYLEQRSWEPVSATAAVPGISVTVTARPTRVVWNMGDGSVVICSGPGRAYDPARPADSQQTDCAHTYRRSSANSPGGVFRIRATVEWAASWTTTTDAGAGPGGSLGTLSQAGTVAVQVAEAQAVGQASGR